MTHAPVSAGFLDVTVQVDIGGQLSDLGKAIKELDKKQQTAVRKRLRQGIAKAGDDLVSAVRNEASWSKRIPSATSLRTSFGARSAGATVVVNATKAPHARPLEGGNRGGMLRHPVFARGDETREQWTWVNQPTHPFFFRAEQSASPLIYARMQKVLDDVADDLGFTGP